MNYVTKDNREVYIFDFETKTKTLVINFAKGDGLVAHMKMLRDNIFYIKNTKTIIVISLLHLNNCFRNTTSVLSKLI